MKHVINFVLDCAHAARSIAVAMLFLARGLSVVLIGLALAPIALFLAILKLCKNR